MNSTGKIPLAAACHPANANASPQSSNALSKPEPPTIGNDIRSEANYLVIRTKRDELSEIFNVGRYIDTIRMMPQGLMFKSRLCIFDSELIKNSIIYPI